MKKTIMTAAIAALVAGCGAQETRMAQAPAKPACEPPPATVVTKDLVEGDGRTAIPLTSALVFYTGWVYDPCAPDHKGAQFDTNVGKRVPFGFRIGAGKVIKGWDQGLVGVPVGSRVQLDIPTDLAYGPTPPSGYPAGPLRFVIDILSAK